jgi:hypothetical protein
MVWLDAHELVVELLGTRPVAAHVQLRSKRQCLIEILQIESQDGKLLGRKALPT